MFKVNFHSDGRYWYKFIFEFETLEEANQFVQSALKHFIKKDEEDDEMIISIEFNQKFKTKKEEINEED